MSKVVNERELRVIGMSRSGNHAVLHWLLSQTDGRHCLLNCAEPRTNPFETARPLTEEQPYCINFPGFHIDQERQGRFSRKDWLIHSYEDCFITVPTAHARNVALNHHRPQVSNTLLHHPESKL